MGEIFFYPCSSNPFLRASRRGGAGFIVPPLVVSLLLLFPLEAWVGVSPPKESPTLLRVAILEGAKQVTLDAQESVLVRSTATAAWGQVTYGPLYVKVNGGKLFLGKKEYRSLQIVPPEGKKILVNNKGYRGFMEIQPQGKDTLLVINVIEVEDYLPGVLREEASPNWPREALLAQAVIARTYALNHRQESEGQLYHLKATVASQVYGGANREDPRLTQAVADTKGLVLSYRQQIIPAFYHAACGGHTEDANLVWPKAPAYMKGVVCNFCQASPYYTWKTDLSLSQIRKTLSSNGVALGEITAWRILETSLSGRITKLNIEHSSGKYTLEGEKLRKILGYDVIRSTVFSVYNSKSKAHFSGRGWGHGVGLCQAGAKGMAEKNYTYGQILKYYFSYADLKKIY
jgi:stage II sporulation protein D